MRLNLGCGGDHLEGWVNVDRYLAAEPDVLWNLEVFPWPWEDNSVDLIILKHVLEHLGQITDNYLAVIKELYRVCKNGAEILIDVPHPLHADYLGDPTHCRPITMESLRLFDLKYAKTLVANKCMGTPLAIYIGVDFEMLQWRESLDDSGAVRASRFILRVRK